ncbi:MAG TPA: hypothetical protein DHW49_08020 [Anaerolineae bacterium]|nr:hypothetical protein [Anaerolineae bacterium]
MNLSNKIFELTENSDGHASAKTIMKFSEQSEPLIGTYSGPNNVYGQVIVKTSKDGLTEMLYQSLTTDDELVAGKAQVILSENENGKLVMQLNWQWLTGSLESGISIWHEIQSVK